MQLRAWRCVFVTALVCSWFALGSGLGWLSVHANDFAELVVGQPVEAVLTGSEPHSYPLALMAGQYVEAVVEQRGVDVIVTLQGPDGKALAQFDTDKRPRGREVAAHIVNATGAHRLLVETRATEVMAGQYTIQLVALRAATAQDRSLQEARSQSAEVQRLISAGKFPEAQPLAERALAGQEQVLGPAHPEVASALTRLATILRNRRELARADTLNQRALAIAESTPEPGHPDLAQILSEMGALALSRADFVKAEPFYQRAIAIWEQTLGPNHPNVAKGLSNLASVYGQRGNYAKAEPALRRALAIREQALGAEHPDLNVTLTLLGNVYFAQKRYDQAAPYYQRVLRVLDQAPAQANPQQLIPVLNNLASIYTEQGKYAQAESLYRRLQPLQEKTLEPNHPQTLMTQFNLATLAAYEGDFARAQQLHQRVLLLREQTLGPDHPDVANSLRNLAHVYTAQGALTQAITTLARANAVIERNLAYNLTVGSESAKRAYLDTAAEETDRAISLHLRAAPKDAEAQRQALTVILQRKGRALDAMVDSLANLRRRATPEDRAPLDQLKTARTEIARQSLAGPPARTPLAEHRARIKALEEKREQLEDQISRRSAELRAQTQPVTLAAVQAAIPSEAALIEFASFRPFNARYTKQSEAYGAPRYVAYVLRHTGEPQALELGDQQTIDAAIERWRKALRDAHATEVKKYGRAVDRLVMQPLRPLLGQTRRVLLAPDGSLNLIPFAALVDGRNEYLIKRYHFSYLTSGRDLLRLQVKQPSRQGALIIANPDFGESAANASSTQRALVARPVIAPAEDGVSILSVAFFPALPGTAGEAAALKELWPDAAVYSAQQATETQLKQADGPAILHIATHGFFLPDATPGTRSAAADPLARLQLDNPLLRSGLALAGANQLKGGPTQEDDGIFTALEAAGLDLWGTRLVVLSACDTGVGEVKTGEGVYGLRRALVLAGSETQVMSLWPVSDAVTRDMMIAYYRGLQQGEARAAALQQVQLRMLERAERGLTPDGRKQHPQRARDYSHPFYWASFILSGEDAKLDWQGGSQLSIR
ncbi:MAG: CHAT domain-containing protein [Acidobacteria bacterium]|nr:CHAT domain-containing protein [Acidobacteriota bacterium]